MATQRLGDLLQIRHGFAFKGEYFARSGEKIVLTPGNFRIGGGLKLRGEREKYYVGDFPARYELKRGELLIAMTDLTQDAPILGSPIRIPESGRFLHNQRLGLVHGIDHSKVFASFLYYLFCDDGVRSQIRSSATGSTVRHTAPERVYKVLVELPELSVQRKIAAILSTYDDLIANNRRRIRILEETARAIYREWFEELRNPEGGAAACGWVAGPMSSFVDINPRENAPSGDVRYLPMDSLSTDGMTIGVYESRTRATGAKFRNSDTLMARITPSLENGKTGFVTGLGTAEVGCGSTEFIVLRGRKLSPEFVYCLARSERVRSVAIGSMTGATGRQRVSTACFDELSISVPPAALDDAFVARVRGSFTLIQSLALENQNLAAQRDLLLPKLITGELDVSELDIDTSRIEEQEELWRESTSV